MADATQWVYQLILSVGALGPAEAALVIGAEIIPHGARLTIQNDRL
jgi:hypothetical protein